MSTSAKVQRLTDLARQIGDETLKLSNGVPAQQDFAYRQLREKLSGWSQTMVHVRKDLKSQTHFNHMVYQKTRHGSGAFAAKQRFASKEAQVATVATALALVNARYTEFLKVLNAGDDPEVRIMKAVAEALDQWQTSIKDSEIDLPNMIPPADLQQTIRQLEPYAPPGSEAFPAPGPMTTILMIATLIAATAHWLRKKGG